MGLGAAVAFGGGLGAAAPAAGLVAGSGAAAVVVYEALPLRISRKVGALISTL